jgi:hypothetical protein
VTLQSATLAGEADSNLLPEVHILEPANNSVFYAGTNIYIEAEASDPDGSVAHVEFFHDNVRLGQVTTPPYSLVWTNPPIGSYTLLARVTDDLNATITSEPVQIDVRPQPLLELHLANPRLEGGSFKFDIRTQLGHTYTLERSDTLSGTDWQAWSSFPGDGNVHTISDSLGEMRRFYRATVQ